MVPDHQSLTDTYTRKVSGETFHYVGQYSTGKNATWSARVFLNGELKGSPSGTLANNNLAGEDLHQYVISYIEGIIERGLGIEE